MQEETFCQFKQVTQDEKIPKWICPACNTTIQTTHPPKSRHCTPGNSKPRPRVIPPPTAQEVDINTFNQNCAHKGALIEERKCKPCQAQGKSAIPVYKCDIYKECTQYSTSIQPRIQGCVTCQKYTPRVQLDTIQLDSKIMHVTLIAPALHNPGGIERWLIAMARYLPLASAGKVSVSVCLREKDKVDPEYLKELSQYTKVLIWDGESALKLNTDVAIVSGMGDVEWCLKDFKKPIVWVSHSSCEWGSAFCEEALAIGQIRHWVSVGYESIPTLPLDVQSDVIVLENGAEIERCTPIRGREWQRRQWGVTPENIVVGFVGRLCHDKKPVALAEAIAYLPKQYVGVVVGQGIQGDDIKQQTYKLVGDRVKFVGHKNLIGDSLAGMDIGFLASPTEGFCLSRTEMFLAGLPVVSTRTGEIPRLETDHGKLVWNIEVGASGEEIAKVIQDAVNDKITSHEIANRARHLSWNQHTVSAMAGRWVDYLHQIA